MELTQLYNNLKALTKDKILNIRVESLDKASVLEKNKEQMIDGVKANGESFSDYKPLTIDIKRETGGFISPSGKIALKDRGDFHNAMKTITEDNELEVFSTDSKEAELIERYGDIFGLTAENEDEVMNESERTFIDNIENQLGL